MKRYLIDTNVCIHLLHDKFRVKEHILEAGLENCYVADITLAELYYGAYNSADPEAAFEGVRFIAELFHNVSLDGEMLRRFGEEKASLRKRGTMIDDFDILIGVTAIVSGMTVVTENVKHLSRLPVNVENWVERYSL